jgi:hypothetical protein
MGGSPRSPSTTYDSQLRAAAGKRAAGTRAAVMPADGTRAAVMPADGTRAAVMPADGTRAAVMPADGMPADGAGVSSAAVVRHLTGDHDLIVRDMNDVITGRLFAAGLDLHIALGLIGDHRAVGTIHHAIGGLDRAIRELRDAAYDPGPHDHHLPR